MTAPPPLSLQLLGAPAVRVAGVPAAADVLWRKHLARMAYLALSPDLVRSRAHLQALRRPEKDAAHARHSLNEAVRRLRAGLGRARRRHPSSSRRVGAHRTRLWTARILIAIFVRPPKRPAAR
jgi:DNA-binding SARP family transcriptional activator